MKEEELADKVHEMWRHWMDFFMSKVVVKTQDDAIRWIVQMQTPYNELSDKDKDSDKAIVRQFLGKLIESEKETKNITEVTVNYGPYQETYRVGTDLYGMDIHMLESIEITDEHVLLNLKEHTKLYQRKIPIHFLMYWKEDKSAELSSKENFGWNYMSNKEMSNVVLSYNMALDAGELIKKNEWDRLLKEVKWRLEQ